MVDQLIRFHPRYLIRECLNELLEEFIVILARQTRDTRGFSDTPTPSRRIVVVLAAIRSEESRGGKGDILGMHAFMTHTLLKAPKTYWRKSS